MKRLNASGAISMLLAMLIIALLFMLIYVGMISFGFVTNELTFYISQIINYTAIVNIGLGVFNLIPLPPLDGSKILMHFLKIQLFCLPVLFLK